MRYAFSDDLWAAFHPLVRQAKQFRRVATRYEKLKVTYLGLLHLVLGFIRFKSQNTVNTP